MRLPFLAFFTALFLFFGAQAQEGAFDPFADYSEFSEANSEENDVNFFKFGRLVSLGVSIGYKGFTGEQQNLIDASLQFGGFFTYYTSLQFAVEIGFTSSTHNFAILSPENNFEAEGKIRYNTFSLLGKYYINTQNLTKSVAKYNPYFVGGVSYVIRESQRDSNIDGVGKEEVVGFNAGFGVEYLFNEKQTFVSLRGVYNLVEFKDENQSIQFLGSNDELVDTGIKVSGDLWELSISIGFNF